MRRLHIYFRILLCLSILSTSVGCMDDDIVQETQSASQEYIGFSASLVAETRASQSEMHTPYLTINEEEWPLIEETMGTRGAIKPSLKDLNVSMYAHSYKNNSLHKDVMDGHHYYFVDNEEMDAKDEYVMWNSVEDSDTLRVYGYIMNDGEELLQASTSEGRTTISYTVDSDVSKQQDVIATEAKEVSSDYCQNIPLTFRHVLAGVRFKAGFDCTVHKLVVKNVFSSGDYIIGDIWKNQSKKSSFTVLDNVEKSCAEGELITTDPDILMMIPQQLPDDACVEMVYSVDGERKTLSAPLKGMRWDKGSLVTYTLHNAKTQNFVYFDLGLGDVKITPTSYSGYVNVGGDTTEVTGTFSASEQNKYKYYIYQSTPKNVASTGWSSEIGVGACRIPSYDPVKVGETFWSEYITNNRVVEDVIEMWDTESNIKADKEGTSVPTDASGVVRASGRVSTPYHIEVNGNNEDMIDCEITIDNIYSRYQIHGATRTSGGLTFRPNVDNSQLTVNAVGDNRFGNIHYYSGRDSKGGLLQNNKLYLKGNGSMTMACVDFFKGMSSQSSSSTYNGDNVTTYFSNYWCSAIGGDDGSEGNCIGLVIKAGTIFAGTTQSENCTAIGGGGNDRGYIDIEGGTVTAVATTTGTAIGGGIGFNSQGGIGRVRISGGMVYAYNHANEWEIPSAAIGSAGSWASSGGDGTVEISGGYVYAEAALGTAIGGGSSKTRQGGNATVNISNDSYVIAKSVAALDKYTNTIYPAGSGMGGGTGGTEKATVATGQTAPPAYGGSAVINISGNPTIRTGSIGGGKTNNPQGKIGRADITVSGGNISAQFVMAGGAGESSSFTMNDGVISNSDVNSKEYYHVSKYGGAVYMEDGVFTMNGGVIRNCHSEMGGAVYIAKSDNALKSPEFYMNGGSIDNCESLSHGGAVYLKGGNVMMSGGAIEYNLACDGNGGGLYIAAGNLTVSGDSRIQYNTAVKHNSQADGSGGGVYVTSPSGSVSVNIESGIIDNNTCMQNGGGVCVDMSNSSGASANINIGKYTGGVSTGPSIANNKAVLYGGGLYANGVNAYVAIDGGNIKNNSVTNYVANEDVANEGGTVTLNDGEVSHVIVTFDVNTTDQSAEVSFPNQKIVTETNSFLVTPVAKRALYEFAGWNSRPDGLGRSYTAGDLMYLSEDITLYAQWKAQQES